MPIEYTKMMELLDEVFYKKLRPLKFESHIRRIKIYHKLSRRKKCNEIDMHFADCYLNLLDGFRCL